MGSSFDVRMRIRTKLAILVVGLILAVMVPLSGYTILSTQSSRRESARVLASTVAKMLAHAEITAVSMGSRMPLPVLKRHVSNAFELNHDIAYLVVTEADGSLRAGKVNRGLVSIQGDVTEEQALAYLGSEGGGLSPDLIVTKVCIENGDQALGNVRVAVSIRPILKQLRRDVSRYIGVTLLLLGAGIIASFGFAGRISRPVEELVSAMERVHDGDFDVRVEPAGADEIGKLSASFNSMTVGLKEKEWITSMFTKYVSKQVAEKILSETGSDSFDGELRKVTVLFCDIRGFTSLSEQLDPKQMVGILNEYFSVLIDVIFKYEGTLDKFVGDQIMAVFGAPLDQDDPELRAVRTAAEIQEAVYAMNERRSKEGKPIVNMGIGINSGVAVAGNIGSDVRKEYTVIGDDVNLAQRIESQSGKGEIMISGSTYRAVADYVKVAAPSLVEVKGRAEPVEVYVVKEVTLSAK